VRKLFSVFSGAFRGAFRANQAIFVAQLPQSIIVRLRLRLEYDISTNKIRH